MGNIKAVSTKILKFHIPLSLYFSKSILVTWLYNSSKLKYSKLSKEEIGRKLSFSIKA